MLRDARIWLSEWDRIGHCPAGSEKTAKGRRLRHQIDYWSISRWGQPGKIYIGPLEKPDIDMDPEEMMSARTMSAFFEYYAWYRKAKERQKLRKRWGSVSESNRCLNDNDRAMTGELNWLEEKITRWQDLYITTLVWVSGLFGVVVKMEWLDAGTGADVRKWKKGN